MENNDKYVGRILDNRYEILELIGAGGMALVYKARCHRLNRMVAVKILKEDLAGDQEFQRRFYTESQAVAMLSHPNIVAVYDVSRSGNVEYIVMELIEGITLKQYINRKGILTWKEVLHFTTQITRALCHAHSRGIIHRDIKPHNIMILKDGSIKVADFGIARLLTVDNTMTQEALGSVHYISPEQAKGGQIDERSDLYSLGVVMYEMLTSRLPFVGDSAVSVAIQHINAIPLKPREINPEVPIGLEDITMHAMEPDLSMRFSSADEMLYCLEEFRKNPAIIFGFASSMMNNRGQDQYDEYSQYDTRVHPNNQHSHMAAAAIVPPPQRQVYQDQHQDRNFQHQDRNFQNHDRNFQHQEQKLMKKPQMSKDDYRKSKKRSRNTATLIGIFSSVLFIVILFVFMWFGFLRDLFGEPEGEILIPNFVGQRFEAIEDNDEYNEIFRFRDVLEINEDFEEGFVFQQSPEADELRPMPPSGRITITLHVSLGPEPAITMPDLVGMHFSAARNLLNDLNLNLEIILEDPITSDVVERNNVIETIPSAGEPLSRGDTVVITYSSGPEIRREVVPNLVGSQLSVLQSAFEALEMIPVIEERQDPQAAGTVIFIEQAGREIIVPAELRVIVSTGPPERTETVPNMIGSQQSALEIRFAGMELTPIFSFREDPSAAGTVIEIERMGETIPVPANINVVISSGPPPPPPPPPPNGGDGNGNGNGTGG